jgi:hypothetical protein
MPLLVVASLHLGVGAVGALWSCGLFGVAVLLRPLSAAVQVPE